MNTEVLPFKLIDGHGNYNCEDGNLVARMWNKKESCGENDQEHTILSMEGSDTCVMVETDGYKGSIFYDCSNGNTWEISALAITSAMLVVIGMIY